MHEVVGGDRLAEVEALKGIAAGRLQELNLCPLFDTFGDGGHAKVFRQGDDGAHNGGFARLQMHILHEGTVDLQLLHRQAFQIGQRRVAGTKIIDGKADTGRAQGGNFTLGAIDIRQKQAFRHFKFDALGRHTGLVQQRQAALGKVVLVKLAGADIDR